MIETHCLKNIVIFIQTISRFVLSRKIINLYNDIAQKNGNVKINKLLKLTKLRRKQQTKCGLLTFANFI